MRTFLKAIARTALALAVLVAAGCADASLPEGSSWRGSVDTLAMGTLLVQNPREALWTDADRWRIVEDLRIGRVSGDGADVFGRVTALAVSPARQIYVLETSLQEIRVFDQEGQFVRTIGRQGSGPGEFAQAYGMLVDTSGNLWVTDYGNARYSVFDSEGRLLRTIRREVSGVVMPWLGEFGEDGSLYDLGTGPMPDGMPSFSLHRVDPSNEAEEVVSRFTFQPSVGAATPTLARLLPRFTLRIDPRGFVWSGQTDANRFLQTTLAGDTVRIVTRVHSPTQVSAAEREAIANELSQLPPEIRAQAAAAPANRPVFSRLHVDDRGHLLVQVHERRLDVYDPDGRYLGAVETPVAFETSRALPVFVDEEVYGLTTDSLGVEYVVRARIERP